MGGMTAFAMAGAGALAQGAGLVAKAGMAATAGQIIGNAALHGMVGGLISTAEHGSFLSGFLAAGVGTLGGPLLNEGSGTISPQGIFVSATLGGVASVLGGGKFQNGAITGAFAYVASGVAARASANDPVAFVGGVAANSMGADGTHVSDYESEFAAANRGVSTSYFSWDDDSGIENWLTNTPGPLTVVCQSAGCGTVADILMTSATNVHLANLIAIDPFNVEPANSWNFYELATRADNWVDISGNPRGLQFFAHWWGGGPSGIATSYLNNSQLMHGDFFGSMSYLGTQGALPNGLNWPH